jgi:hypothetical protein
MGAGCPTESPLLGMVAAEKPYWLVGPRTAGKARPKWWRLGFFVMTGRTGCERVGCVQGRDYWMSCQTMWSSCGVAGDKSMAWKLDRAARPSGQRPIMSVIQALAEALAVD